MKPTTLKKHQQREKAEKLKKHLQGEKDEKSQKCKKHKKDYKDMKPSRSDAAKERHKLWARFKRSRRRHKAGAAAEARRCQVKCASASSLATLKKKANTSTCGWRASRSGRRCSSTVGST